MGVGCCVWGVGLSSVLSPLNVDTRGSWSGGLTVDLIGGKHEGKQDVYKAGRDSADAKMHIPSPRS